MDLAWITHDCFEKHDTGLGHPERPERIRTVWRLKEENPELHRWKPILAQPASLALLGEVHPGPYVENLKKKLPKTGTVHLDPDTVAGPASWDAALRAAGAAQQAVTGILEGKWTRAFCAVRPPGHHAEPDAILGFCLFNNVAVAARRALQELDRIAIVDFDVHHGNGTESLFADDPRVLFCSSFQHPFYPNRPFRTECPHIVNVPLPAGTGSTPFREAIRTHFWRAIERHRPQLILISAGFDAHRDDPLAQFQLEEDDFRWISEELVALSRAYCEGKIVSTLEGGYDLGSLRASLHQHLLALMED